MSEIIINSNIDKAYVDNKYENMKHESSIAWSYSGINNLYIVIKIKIDAEQTIDKKDIKIQAQGFMCSVHSYGTNSRNRFIVIAKIPYRNLMSAKIHTRIRLVYKDSEGKGFRVPLRYCSEKEFKRIGLYNLRGLKIIKSLNSSVYINQSRNNSIYVTFRRQNITDKRLYRLKLYIAKKISKRLPKDNKIILYEKESEKYEESASVLYERLIDDGYNNAYFILGKHSPYKKFVKLKYASNIVYKHSFKHYLYFFNSNVFIGTELPVHAIDLRVASKEALKKLTVKN